MSLAEDPDAPIEPVLMHPPCSYRQIAFDTLTNSATGWKAAVQRFISTPCASENA